MSPATLAVMCGVLYSPPAMWDDLPLPDNAKVVELPFKQMQAICKPLIEKEYKYAYACTDLKNNVAYLPTWKTWIGSKDCYDELRRHELAHLKGWRHP